MGKQGEYDLLSEFTIFASAGLNGRIVTCITCTNSLIRARSTYRLLPNTKKN
jgi:hypothetical protein